MKHLACNDVSPEGTPDCPFIADGATNEEVVEKMKTHGGDAHADMMSKATPESMAAWPAMAMTKITETAD